MCMLLCGTQVHLVHYCHAGPLSVGDPEGAVPRVIIPQLITLGTAPLGIAQCRNASAQSKQERANRVHTVMSCTTTHTATHEAMPAVVHHPHHRDFGTHPLPTDRSALLNEQREYKTYVTNYQTDVWDVERAVPTKTSTAASSASTRSTLRSRSCRRTIRTRRW